MPESLQILMQDPDMRKACGQRLKKLRKAKHWTQKELAEKIGVGFAHLNKYEGGMHVPPVERLVLLARLFDTTVDYLLLGERREAGTLHNVRLFERFRALQDLPPEEQETVIKLIDAVIVKQRVEGAIRAVGG